jgi:hypothetical protein
MSRSPVPELLEQYLDDLDRVGYRLRDNLHRPGLTDAAIERLMLPTGVALPPAVLDWWNVQNGLITRAEGPVGAMFEYAALSSNRILASV